MLQGDTARARPLLERFVRDTVKVFGENHVNTGNALQSLAELERTEGRLDEARAFCARALASYEHVGMRRSPSAVFSLLTLAQTEEADGHLPVRRAGRVGEANALSSRADEIRRKSGQTASIPSSGTAPTLRIEKTEKR